MRRIWIALVVVALFVGTSPAVAGDPPVTLPSKPTGLVAPVTLPEELDPPAPYLPQTSCSPTDLPGVVKLRDLVLQTYDVGSSGAISRGCTEGVSEHIDGRAWDWMVDTADKKEKAAAADFLSWVTRNNGRNARRLGIMYVIYNQKIWGVYNAKEGWRPSSGHKDHVHVSLSWNGARGNVSFWTGTVSKVDYGPCVRFKGTYAARTGTPRTGACPPVSSLLRKTSLGSRQYGRTGDTVAMAQGRLGVKKTRRFDRATWTAVLRYQRAHDLPYTGVLDQPTWASLVPSRQTYRAVKGYTRSTAIAYGVEHYSDTVLKRGRVAKAVVFLQTALGLPMADRNGFFDTVTLAAVKKMQQRAGMAQDGIVRGEEWRAMADARG